MSPVTPATAGLPCSEPSDKKSSPLWQKSKRQAGGQSHPGMFEKQKYIRKREASSAPGHRPGKHRGAALGFCVLCVYGFLRNETIPAINNGLILSFVWAVNVYYIYAFVPHFARFL